MDISTHEMRLDKYMHEVLFCTLFIARFVRFKCTDLVLKQASFHIILRPKKMEMQDEMNIMLQNVNKIGLLWGEVFI
ncbi:hypothetical protein C5468_20290 [Photorhabdus luminescens subsp. mexicana]|uniref:Uncharacterized protein n=1 Tax=Photorhabdus luminescens subsp. mexicana TaxID=2100167 RepID=A0A4R4IX83_PHOLU|nr:hypothetical protein C5468_20290 [Photorhabdus luminescens subsp. mexicana]